MRTLAQWSGNDAVEVIGGGDAEIHQVALRHHAVVIASSPPDLDFNALASTGVVVATVESVAGALPNPSADVWLSESEIERFADVVNGCPKASVVCARQLRLVESLDPSQLAGARLGLEAESLSYSALQAGPEFDSWLERQPQRVRRIADQGRVTVRESPTTSSLAAGAGNDVEIELCRPRLKNALDVAMRNQLIEVLDALTYRDDIATITLCGAGSAFCIGGDLAEFGTVDNPTDAHLIRLATSLGQRLLSAGPKLQARVHGPTVGAGVELAAFAGTVVAAANTTFRLPEISMGLLPGAGGTVSLTRRIGRHKTARLLLLNQLIDAEGAQSIGLVDHIDG